jgi:uncharacterized phage-associated protein
VGETAMIQFKFKPEKFASAVTYIATRLKASNATKKVICKLIFFADQKHLLTYGRTITGDKYNALPQGPIPSRGLDMLNQKACAPADDLAVMREYGQLKGWTFVSRRPPNLAVFSKSDLVVLDQTIAELGSLDHKHLEDLSHKEAAWIRANSNATMDFDLFFEGHPETEALRRIVNLEHSPA